jgi:hypothetical protein
LQVAKISQDQWLQLRTHWLAAKESWDYRECDARRACGQHRRCGHFIVQFSRHCPPDVPSPPIHSPLPGAGDKSRPVEVDVTDVIAPSLLEDSPSAAERLRAINARLEAMAEYRGSTISKVGRGRGMSLRLRLSGAAMRTFFKPSLSHTLAEARKMLANREALDTAVVLVVGGYAQ